MFENGEGGSLDALCAAPLGSLDDERLLARMQELERIRSRVDAEQCAALAEFARRRDTDECGAGVGDEVGLALRIASRTADRRIGLAVALVDRLPRTVAAMGRGELTQAAAWVLLEETGELAASDAHAVESRLLPVAPDLTPGQLRRRAARAAIAIDPAAAARRRRAAEAERSVWLRPEVAGMATLGARLCAADAVGIFEIVDQNARSARGAGDPRTLEQLRADIFVQRIVGPASTAGRPLVQITVAADAVTSDAAPPAELGGYGPIDHDLAREIVATGVWQRLIADPVTGAITEAGRARYRPPAALADLVRARGRSCAFPTCQRPAAACDLDHRRQWSAGGHTSADNLWPLCARHHAVKDGHPGWSCEVLPDGRIRWRTPTGRVYTIQRSSGDADTDLTVASVTIADPPPDPTASAEDLPPPF
ncbi:MAG: DUF222 domain-containing protein [Mycobacteriales bacterium]